MRQLLCRPTLGKEGMKPLLEPPWPPAGVTTHDIGSPHPTSGRRRRPPQLHESRSRWLDDTTLMAKVMVTVGRTPGIIVTIASFSFRILLRTDLYHCHGKIMCLPCRVLQPEVGQAQGVDMRHRTTRIRPEHVDKSYLVHTATLSQIHGTWSYLACFAYSITTK